MSTNASDRAGSKSWVGRLENGKPPFASSNGWTRRVDEYVGKTEGRVMGPAKRLFLRNEPNFFRAEFIHNGLWRCYMQLFDQLKIIGFVLRNKAITNPVWNVKGGSKWLFMRVFWASDWVTLIRWRAGQRRGDRDKKESAGHYGYKRLTVSGLDFNGWRVCKLRLPG